ncbi:unnamed protein product [Ranitomeya imitator]|uniref:Menorin-like domain-containing protein n=1 Tax=Ranitomeya imitator TaxID=111125 RepID=A0ABN9LHW9_9NEOB|nr:unnamed protein product [Ranitomeya imitator]
MSAESPAAPDTTLSGTSEHPLRPAATLHSFLFQPRPWDPAPLQPVSLDAVLPSMKILDAMKDKIHQPVWINADILHGPGGNVRVEATEFLKTVTSFFPDFTLSLGWTTVWYPDRRNEGYSWEMVREMEKICKGLSQPVTFPVRAVLVRQSWPQLQWLLQTSDR